MMGDTPGMCTRLQAKRMSLSLTSPKDSSGHGKKQHRSRLPSVTRSKKADSLSSIKHKSTDENENDASKNSPKKSKVTEGPKNGHNSFSSVSTDENLVFPSSSSGSQSSPRSLRPRLSSIASNLNTSSASAKKRSALKRKIKYASESDESEGSDSESEKSLSLLVNKVSESKKLETKQVPENTKVHCSPRSCDSSLEASPEKKRKTSVCRSASLVDNSTAGVVDELAVQGDAAENFSSGEKDISSSAVTVDASLALRDDKKKAYKSCGETTPSNTVPSTDSFQETSKQDIVQSLSMGDKTNVSVSLQRLSPLAVLAATTGSQQSIPSKVGQVTEIITDGYSSDNTFEEISEKTEEEIITSVDPVQEKLSTSGNFDGVSNLETVVLGDSTTFPCRTSSGTEALEGKKCAKDDHKNDNSLKNKSDVESLSSSDTDVQVVVTDVIDKSSSSNWSSKDDVQNLLGDSTSKNIVPVESDQVDSKIQSTMQNVQLSPDSLNKSVISLHHPYSGKDFKSEHKPCAQKSILSSESCNKPEVYNSDATTSDKQKGEQNGQVSNKMTTVCDVEESSLDDEITRTPVGTSSVSNDNTKITQLITLDSDESSEFCVTEVKTGTTNKLNGEGIICKNVDSDQDIIIRSVAAESEEDSTDGEERVNKDKNNEIKIIEVDTVGEEEKSFERLENKGGKEEPENTISSLQNTVLSRQCCLNLYKEIISKNKLLEKNLVPPKSSSDLVSKKSTVNESKSNNLKRRLCERKSGDQTFQKSKKSHLKTAETRYESGSIVSKNILSPNFESKCKGGNVVQSNENVPQKLTNKLKDRKDVPANKFLEINLDISSSDVEEVMDSSSMLNMSKSKLKAKCKSSLSGSKMLPGSVSVKSQILEKQKQGRTEVKNVEENSQSDSDAESRKRIRQKAKLRIAESVAESTGSTSKQATSDNEGSASAPDNVNFVARPRFTSDSLASEDADLHQTQLLKLKRRKRLKMLKQQKEEKLNRLKESMASKEDASCSSSESSVEEHEKGNTTPYLHNGFLVSSVNQGTKQERISDSHPAVKMKKKMNKASRSIAGVEELSCRATTQWVIEDLTRNSRKLRRLPESVLGKLTSHGPKVSKSGVEAGAKDQQIRVKRKQWKDTGVTVSGFNVTTDADFIPLKTGTTVQFGVMPLDKMMKAAPAFAKDSANFRHNMLYSKHIRREPAKAVLDRQLKLKAGGKDGLVRFSHM